MDIQIDANEVIISHTEVGEMRVSIGGIDISHLVERMSVTQPALTIVRSLDGTEDTLESGQLPEIEIVLRIHGWHITAAQEAPLPAHLTGNEPAISSKNGNPL